jgi:hypothetical protein
LVPARNWEAAPGRDGCAVCLQYDGIRVSGASGSAPCEAAWKVLATCPRGTAGPGPAGVFVLGRIAAIRRAAVRHARGTFTGR